MCWSYANEWMKAQPELIGAGVKGPVFVTIGDSDKLKIFLENNPNVPRDSIFTEGFQGSDAFAAYNAVGFGKWGGDDPSAASEPIPPPKGLSFGQWMSYIFNVLKISPVPDGLKLGQIPEGVLRLGGTFVVKGNDVVYQWSDDKPGDHPDISEVVTIAKREAQGDAVPAL
eukprot:gnl/MRDRNA2_/MRDRNA2_30601_c0_seq1.p2 gnl/MRDRNA2_/MRDRNA2_30601_c0~~gnl/MRDRNA2_/MRDRNA2_30601_c0_seq1.p2  ORF type:complete len:170 (+),score=42.69 gnl/MRDRNA2_/MRDRNA2_30601_c0_seq1:606-1115(+)